MLAAKGRWLHELPTGFVRAAAVTGTGYPSYFSSEPPARNE